MISVDLHLHSCYSSDGEVGITEIMEHCIQNEISLFSITDHNSVKGNQEASQLAHEKGIEFIPGIEIDCNYEGTDLHLLGYGINWESPDFLYLEDDIFQKAMTSLDSMIKNLHFLGFSIDKETVLMKANGKQPTGELIAEIMLTDKKYHTPLLEPYMPGGERSSMPYINFYLDYFAQGKPAYVAIDYISYEEAIQMIRDNGGIPIVAHPGLNFNGQEKRVEQLLNKGSCGLEVCNNYHSTEQMNYFASLVRQNEAIMTCGSDFHGKTKPLINIGEYKFDNKYEDYLIRSVQQLKTIASIQ